MSDVLRDLRKHVAKKIVDQLAVDNNTFLDWVFKDAARKAGRPVGSYKVWEPGGHPEAIESEMFYTQKLNYLHDNPVRKGLVYAPEHWRYSSAGYYVGDRVCPLELDVLEY